MEFFFLKQGEICN